jgi:hypothetical protein
MTPSSRGRRALQILAVLLAIPLLGAGGVWFWIQRRAERKWADARLRIQELSRTCPAELPPPPSSEIPKELQIHFVAAIREAARRNGRRLETGKLVRHRQGGEAVDVVLGDAQEALDRLHEGARRCARTPEHFPPGWRGEWDADTLEFLMNCCVLRARRLREREAPWEAAQAILDSLQLARFWAASGKGETRLDAMNSLEHPLDELRDILAREKLSREELRGLDRELEPLEATLRPPTAYFPAALARWAEELEQRDLKDSQLLDEAPYRWRYLLPTLLMKAEAFEFYDLHLRRLIADGEKSFLDLARDARRMHEQREASKNPLVSQSSVIRELEWNGLERMAQFRLLRVAAHYRASGEVLPLKDPYGTELRHSRSGSRMRFWSVDGDGRDDGGDAGSEGRWTWQIPVPGAPPPRPPKDIVIDVELSE